MNKLRTIGLALLALLALGALAASSASAEEGFLPVTKKGFTILTKTARLETTKKEVITCGETKGSGTFETDQHGTITIDHLKCEIVGFPAFSLGEKEPKEAKEALILIPALFLICLIEPKKLLFGIFIEPKEVTHIHIRALGMLVNVKGSFIGEILTQKGKLFIPDFTGKEGKQNVTECKDEAGNVKKAQLEAEADPNAAVGASLTIEGALAQFEEEVELMDK